jgi:hypothetical protein
MRNYIQITENLKTALSRKEQVSDQFYRQLEYAIGQCKLALDQLRELAVTKGFPDKKSEILFFKQIKPEVYSQLLYYQALFELESVRLRTDTFVYAEKLVGQQRQILDYFDEHQVKVEYYRCGFKHLDEKYFLRDEQEIPVQLRNHIALLDEKFFTWHDHTFSLIKAYDLLLDYIAHEILKYGPNKQTPSALLKSKLRWTGKKINLVELIYAIHESGEVNDGDASIAELTRAFECSFNVKLSNYQNWTEIKQRKKNPADFLNKLIAFLYRKIDRSFD